jgi:hypothetical protein
VKGEVYKVFLDDDSIEQLWEFSMLLHTVNNDAPRFLRFSDESVGGLKIFNINRIALIMVPNAAYEQAEDE